MAIHSDKHNCRRDVVKSFRLSPFYFELIKQECAMRNLEFSEFIRQRTLLLPCTYFEIVPLVTPRARANSVSAVPFWYPLKPEGFNLLLTKPRPSMKPLNTRGSSMDQALMVRIRERAYHIWEESGGHADDNWLQAETEILQLGMPPTSLPSIPKEQRSRSNRVRAPGTGTKRFLSRAAL
jgi:hypothetical protein